MTSKPLFALLIALSWLCLASCSPFAGLGDPCESGCDCDRADAPVKCVGEWVCNVEKTCEYECKTPCSELPYTCASGEECNGTICSERGACP